MAARAKREHGAQALVLQALDGLLRLAQHGTKAAS
jgi:hypothetical protein